MTYSKRHTVKTKYCDVTEWKYYNANVNGVLLGYHFQQQIYCSIQYFKYINALHGNITVLMIMCWYGFRKMERLGCEWIYYFIYCLKEVYQILFKKRLKIPKGQSESLNWRRTDNTMSKRKMTNNYLPSIAQKDKDRTTRTPLNTGG